MKKNAVALCLTLLASALFADWLQLEVQDDESAWASSSLT